MVDGFFFERGNKRDRPLVENMKKARFLSQAGRPSRFHICDGNFFRQGFLVFFVNADNIGSQ